MNNKKINILPEYIANKIAAGEVVQRPESVVKELLENSMDAGAKNIQVIIKRAGKSLIQVIDDGCGMSEDDAILSFKRHATSKVSKTSDLDAINTFGFRGEALSSISSVSQLEIKTKLESDDLGTEIKIDGSEVTVSKIAFPMGTSIAVKNIFYNVPARRKFLKSHSTELKYIIDTFTKISLSHPNISFKLYNDDDLLFDFKESDSDKRLKSVIADNIFDVALPIKEDSDYLNISGYIAKPSYLKNSKSSQYLFINKRFVKSNSINHAVFSAYEGLLEKGEYPFFVLYLTLDPSKIDINIHPQKLEVKFDDEKGIYSYVKSVVKKSLGGFAVIPNKSTDNERLYNNHSNKSIDTKGFINGASGNNRKNNSLFSDDDIDRLFSDIKEENSYKEVLNENELKKMDELNKEVEQKHSHSESNSGSSFIVSLHNKFILAPIKTGLMVIDQNLAHERILYENALLAFKNEMPISQQLLFSEIINVTPEIFSIFKKIEGLLSKIGFQLKYSSKKSIKIEGVPPDIKVGTEKETLLNVLNELLNLISDSDQNLEEMIALSYARNAAIKSGDKLSEQEMRVLVDKLFATSTPFVCPSGRPIINKIPISEINIRFGR